MAVVEHGEIFADAAISIISS